MYVRVGSINVFYETLGSGKPLLFIHGFGIDSTVMRKAVEPIFNSMDFNKAFMRVYFDLPGVGKTRGTEGIENADDMLDLIVGFKEKIIGDKAFSVVGYSYGGYLARGLLKLQRERVDGLFLLCPVIYPDKANRKLPPFEVVEKDSRLNELWRDEMNTVGGERAYKKFLSSCVIQNKYTWKRYLNEVYPGFLNANKNFLKRYQENGYSFSLDPDIVDNPFKCPAVFLTGRMDSVVGYIDSLKLLSNYPRGSFVILDRAGHMLHIEKSGVFQSIFVDWLLTVLI